MPSASDLNNQGFYSPLSQNMTDSENSENEQLANNSSSLISNTNLNILNKTANRQVSINSQTLSGGVSHLSGSTNINYSNLNDVNNHFRQPHSNQFDVADNVPAILMNIGLFNHNSDQYGLKFSRIRSLRKFCLFTSLLIFILTVFLLLWVLRLPCSNVFVCSVSNNHLRTNNWIKKYEKLELKGTINVIDGVRGKSKNLVFMYRGDKMWSSSSIQKQKRNGIISFMSNTGEISWFDEIKNEPSIIDCGLIDADGNGSPDCLVLDQNGELGCINPITGQWLWHIADRTVKNSALISFPLILPDLNDDGIKELLVTSSTSSSVSTNNSYYNGSASTNFELNFWNKLSIVSGKTGLMIGTGFSFPACSFIHKFQLDKRYNVSFNCINNETEIQIVKPLEELYRLITNKTIKAATSNTKNQWWFGGGDTVLNQHKFYGQRKDTLLQRNIYSVSGKQLVVENNGKCPAGCNVTVQLVEQKNGKQNIIPIVNGTRMYGMVPALLTFNSTSINRKSIAVHGFVIKFWEWGPNETSTFRDFLSFSRRPRRNIQNTTEGDEIKLNETTIVRLIKETVVLIVFNSTDIRFESTSQNSIIQLCKTSPSNTEEYICQPDLNYQENSVIIADIDDDGAQELVTYYSTFINVGDDNRMDWRLTTYMQLLRLEAELPKLYADEDKH